MNHPPIDQICQWNSKLFFWGGGNVLGIPDIFLILFLDSWNSILFTLTHSGWYRGHWNSRHFLNFIPGIPYFFEVGSGIPYTFHRGSRGIPDKK